MTRGWNRRGARSLVAAVVVAMAATGCGSDDIAAEDEPIETPTAIGTDGEAVAGGNPCGPDGDGEIPGPPGEPAADDAEVVEVTAVDYAFEGVDASYEAGSYGFTLVNEGDEVHELVLLKLADGVSAEDLLDMSDDEAEEAIEFVTGAIACPGDEAETVGAELDAGTYAMVCFLPVGSTDASDLESVDGPSHAEKGMMVELTVP